MHCIQKMYLSHMKTNEITETSDQLAAILKVVTTTLVHLLKSLSIYLGCYPLQVIVHLLGWAFTS